MKTYHYLFVTILLLSFIHQSYSQFLLSKIDKLVHEYVVDHQFMCSVLVADKGKVVFAKGYGLADVEQMMLLVKHTS